MLQRELLGSGVDLYHVICWFFLFSFLGWLVESIYMSICEKKLTNRGFMAGPLCPIYGFGATAAYFVLCRMSGHYVAIYLFSAISATIFEFLVGKLMIRIFGDFWWDYNEKPFNYKGILCLESTLAWGLYGVVFMAFVYDGANWLIDRLPRRAVLITISVLFVVECFDFAYHVLKEKWDNMPENVEEWREFISVHRR